MRAEDISFAGGIMEKKFKNNARNPACISMSLIPRNRSGLSQIVTTLLFIVLSLVAVGVVWGFVNNLITKQTSANEACYGNFDKITINNRYTCYELNNGVYNLRFSLSLGEVDVEKVIVGISSASATKSYEIPKTLQTVSGLKPVPSGTQVKLPDKNSGLTYNATGFTSKIDSVQIIPVIGGTQCQISDTISQIENCVLLV